MPAVLLGIFGSGPGSSVQLVVAVVVLLLGCVVAFTKFETEGEQ